MENDELISLQEGSDLLGTSVDYLIGLINSQKITASSEGEQMVLRREVLSYKEKIDQERMRILDRLTAEAEELNMGY